MTRKVLTALLNLILRIFYHRIEVAGRNRIPKDGPVIFVLNHPNGLLDPVFILCLAPRPVSLLGKSTLFKMPVIGWLARALDTLPVYRQQDKGENPKRNKETFQKCRELLERGGSLALFPEGVSHSEPSLRPLKTGAARIALGAASAGMKQPLQIVPAGLYYTAKATFRSSALLYFGEPITVNPVTLDENYEPARDDARALSERLDAALREVTLNADQKQALDVVARAEEIFNAGKKEEPSLAEELLLKQRFVEGYEFYRTHAPEKLEAIEARIRQYAEQLRHVGLEVNDLTAATHATPGKALRRVLSFALLLPFALIGVVVHYPAYRLAGVIACQIGRKDDDIISTIKVLASALLFPLTWVLCAGLCAWYFGWAGALVALFCLPLLGYLAMRFAEEFDRASGAAKAMLFFVTRGYFAKRLLAERRAIQGEILALNEDWAKTK
ncbi:MAG TPA: lysophospholipid acyltransferase family protein [Blastocatellia bacterium]|nr:lysophospholipid acyltransferase family protein [Blastocatellia bacterium]